MKIDYKSKRFLKIPEYDRMVHGDIIKGNLLHSYEDRFSDPHYTNGFKYDGIITFKETKYMLVVIRGMQEIISAYKEIGTILL